MARRHSNWEASLAAKLRKPSFAREFLLALVEEGEAVQSALADVIRRIGVKEFAAEVGMPGSNVLRAIHPGSNPTLGTLDRLLKPFGLRLSLAKTSTANRRRSRAESGSAPGRRST